VGVASANGDAANSQSISADWTRAVARDLRQHRGSSLVIAGEEQPPYVHALAHAMNASLGNVGKTVYYTDPLETNPTDGMESLRDLANDMKAGNVDVLLILGGNPVYDAPVDFDFGPALLNVKLRIHSGLYYDETGELCHWHVPSTHYLESWGDARAYDGTLGIIQPLIAPLYQGCHSPYEILGLLGNDPGKSNHDVVRDYWAGQRPEKDKAFEDFWERTLHDGVMPNTALPAINVVARTEFAKPPNTQATSANTATASDLEISFRPGGCRKLPSRTRD
jgi:anaerobic selenocysteine-containing dehydrogenase